LSRSLILNCGGITLNSYGRKKHLSWGIQKISKADQAQIDFLKGILESLGVDTDELRTLADYQEALKEATQG